MHRVIIKRIKQLVLGCLTLALVQNFNGNNYPKSCRAVIVGLDFTHTGLVYRQSNGNLGLIHASPAGKVTLAKDLQNYVKNVKNAIGIVVTRVDEPKLP